MGRLCFFASLILSVGIAGCAAEPVNPSLSLSREEAGKALTQIKQARAKAIRPIVLIGGYGDPGWGSAIVAARVRTWFDGDAVIITVNPAWSSTFDAAREQVIEAVNRELKSKAGEDTPDVDVIGLSMGGLVARHSACEIDGTPRLSARRIFTISSPHQGAKLAEVAWGMEPKILDLRPNSGFLQDVARHDKDAKYELYCYTRLDDTIVGEMYAAPPGQTAWWVSNPAGDSSHLGAFADARILGDIARRLRGESPLASAAPVPLPVR